MLKVTKDRAYPLHDGRTVTYYKVDDWSFSDLPEEDADFRYALRAARAWIIWAGFLLWKKIRKAPNEPAQ